MNCVQREMECYGKDIPSGVMPPEIMAKKIKRKVQSDKNTKDKSQSYTNQSESIKEQKWMSFWEGAD